MYTKLSQIPADSPPLHPHKLSSTNWNNFKNIAIWKN